MRSWKILTFDQVQAWVWNWLSPIRLPDHGWLCTAIVVWKVLVRAAAGQQTIHAVCADLRAGPSGQALFDALRDGLPARVSTLEQRLVQGLQTQIPRSVRRKARRVAIDWHLIPYHGEPYACDNELYHSVARSGTTKFHAYATACIIERGQRYTVALTWVKRNESVVTVLQRLWLQMQQIDLKIKVLLLDRQFFSRPVMTWLIGQRLPFLMPVVMRGRKPKPGRRARGLRRLHQQPVGWYLYSHGTGNTSVTTSICITYKTYTDHRSGKRHSKKLLFAAWGVHGSPREVCQQYRLRFGIETSYRQLNQARIRTATREPKLRLLFVGVALILRNVWVWIHATVLCKQAGEHPRLQLDLLRFRTLLTYLARAASLQVRNHSPPCADYK
jgi:DDE family transposase